MHSPTRGAEQLARPEHERALRGRGRYLDDLPVPGAAHVAFVRSPHAHARLRGLSVQAARDACGVLCVVTGADLAGRVAPIQARMRTDGDYCYRPTGWHPMPATVVRYVGEIVAAVVACDRYLAEDAAALVEADYDPLPALGDARLAMGKGAVPLHAEHPDNVLFEMTRRSGDQGAFDRAPVRARITCRHPRVAGMPMEGCGAVASYSPQSQELEVRTSTQVPHLVRTALGGCLGIDAQRIRVIAPDVGGGFGTKMHLFPEEVLVAHLALRLGGTVKWTQDRMEHLQASFHARDVTVEAELAAEADGTLVGLRARAWCDVGAYSAFPITASLEPQTIGACLPGPYRLAFYQYEGYALATNKFPEGAYRGVGFPLGPLVLEPLLDRVAAVVGVDPMAIRRRNLLTPAELPCRTLAGSAYDSGDYPALLDALAETYRCWRAEQSAAPPGARRLGIGLACLVEATGMNRAVYARRGMVEIPAFDAAVIRVDPAGGVEAAVSTPSQGQSHHGTFRRMLAEALGITDYRVRITLGDTGLTPYGSGTFASRSVVCGGGALLKAAHKLRTKLCAIAAARWSVAPGTVEFSAGAARHPDRAAVPLTLRDLARIAYRPDEPLPREIEPGLEVHAAYDPPGVPTSSAAHLALVEVDPRRGAVQVLRYVVAEDCGPIVNRMAVDGQIRGAVVQGIGCALLESIDYDEAGQHRSATLADYLIPGTHDAPHIDIVHLETPSPYTEGGHKGMGESGIIGAPAAIANAVHDALGIRPPELCLPFTPERVMGLWGDHR